jgi:diguanylate cyclase (GGDEF)-like protein
MEPYLPMQLSYQTIIKEYYIAFIILIAFVFLLLLFNRYLNAMVNKRTQALKEANENLKVLAQTDELTQITNRRQFLKMAETYFSIAKRNNTPLLLLSLDIDWFKHVNDTYGHHVGDEVLKLFVRTIEQTLRKSDIFGRIGGEEFSILLQNTNNENGLYLANKIRKLIETTPYVSQEHGEIYFTVSIGLSSLTQDFHSFSQLMKNADEALYKAKSQGRNKATFV